MSEEPVSIIQHYLQKKAEGNSLFVGKMCQSYLFTKKSSIEFDVSPLLIGSAVFVRPFFPFCFLLTKIMSSFLSNQGRRTGVKQV